MKRNTTPKLDKKRRISIFIPSFFKETYKETKCCNTKSDHFPHLFNQFNAKSKILIFLLA